MEAVLLIDSAPGFEDSVEAYVRKLEGVTAVLRHKAKNYDLAVLISVGDASDVQRFMSGRLHLVTGVQGLQKLDDPPADLLERLARATV